MSIRVTERDVINTLTLYLREQTGYEHATIYEVIQTNQAIDLEFRVSFSDSEHRIFEVDERNFKVWLRRKKLEKIIGNIE